MADNLTKLLAELGGDSPQNRAIAEGLSKQGIGSTKEIGVKQVLVPGYSYGSDESAGSVPDSTRNVYFNKVTGSEINPNRLGIIQNGQSGVKDGDIFFHLNADDQGNVKFEPEWSPRAHGFLRDNPIGQLIMKAGAIIPNPFQPAFVAANVGDALAHEKYAKALLAALPYAAQEFGITDALKGYASDALGLGPDVSNPSIVGQTGLPSGLPEDLGGLSNGVTTESVLTPRFTSFETMPVDGSPLDVSLADQAFQNITNPVTLDDLVGSKNYGELNGILSDPSELTSTNISDTTSLYPNANPDNPNTVLDPKKDFMGRDINDAMKSGLAEPTQSSVSDWSKDMIGRPINDTVTLDKVLDFGKAYLSNPAALAGAIGTGLAATGLVNNVIGGNKVVDTNQVADSAATKPVASMVPVGSTPGLQDLFNYVDLYKSSPFAQQQTQQPTQQQPPGFTVSDVFRSLMADAGPQPKIEPNLVGLVDLQKQMARK